MLSRLSLRRRSRGFVTVGDDPGTAALSFLLAQGLPTEPRYYAVMHHAFADPSCDIAQAIADILDREGRVTLGELDALLATHAVADADQAQTQADRQQLRLQALQLADLAADAVAATGQFGRDLTAALAKGVRDSGTLDEIIVVMVERTRRTEQQLASAVAQIDRLRDEVAAARSDAVRDELTGLLNRRGIIEVLSGDEVKPSVIAICDADRFKSINDAHGHAVGDRVLKVIADALEDGCTPHIVGRWGGEEFLVLFRDIDVHGAAIAIDTVRQELSARRLRARENGAHLGTVTFSAGIAAFAGDFDQALREADALLYRAKLDGRDRVLHGGQSSPD